MIWRIGWMKPMSSIWSASSSTSTSTRCEQDVAFVHVVDAGGRGWRRGCRRRAASVSHLGAMADAAEHRGDGRRPSAGRRCGSSRRSARPARASATAPGTRAVLRGAAALTVGGEAVQDRQREGRGLAGAGLGDAQQVAALQHGREWPGPGSAWAWCSLRTPGPSTAPGSVQGQKSWSKSVLSRVCRAVTPAGQNAGTWRDRAIAKRAAVLGDTPRGLGCLCGLLARSAAAGGRTRAPLTGDTPKSLHAAGAPFDSPHKASDGGHISCCVAKGKRKPDGGGPLARCALQSASSAYLQ